MGEGDRGRVGDGERHWREKGKKETDRGDLLMWDQSKVDFSPVSYCNSYVYVGQILASQRQHSAPMQEVVCP